MRLAACLNPLRPDAELFATGMGPDRGPAHAEANRGAPPRSTVCAAASIASALDLTCAGSIALRLRCGRIGRSPWPGELGMRASPSRLGLNRAGLMYDRKGSTEEGVALGRAAKDLTLVLWRLDRGRPLGLYDLVDRPAADDADINVSTLTTVAVV